MRRQAMACYGVVRKSIPHPLGLLWSGNSGLSRPVAGDENPPLRPIRGHLRASEEAPAPLVATNPY